MLSRYCVIWKPPWCCRRHGTTVPARSASYGQRARDLHANRVWSSGIGSSLRLVGRDHHAGGRRLAVDEAERGVGTAVGKEAAPRPQAQRVDHEHVPVAEVAPHQRLDQFTAAEHEQVLTLFLEPGNGLRSVAPQQRGVLPGEWL